MINALKSLEELLSNDPDNTLQAAVADQDIQNLEMLFVRYETMLSELGDCIHEYQMMYKIVRKDVLAPNLRKLRNEMRDSDSQQYNMLTVYISQARSY